MYNADTDLLFHPRAILALLDARGVSWKRLVAAVIEAGPDSPGQMALILMMARMNNCATCNADSFRAMNGCTTCALQSLKRFRGPDKELQGIYKTTLTEVNQYLENHFQK